MTSDERGTPAETRHADRGSIHIMLAASDDEVRGALESTLRRNRLGHGLIVVDGAADMLADLKRATSETRGRQSALPSLILACFDDMDDETLFRELRADVRVRSIPIIVFVHKGERMRTARLYHLGASSVIQLPLFFADLVDIMRVIEQYWGHTARLPNPNRQ